MSDTLTTTGVPAPVAVAVRRIYQECQGRDLPARIVDAAASGDEHLRRYFEWDDGTAAHHYRLIQAQALIRRVRVNVIQQGHVDPIAVRAFVAGKDIQAATDTGGGNYLAIEDVTGATAHAALLESIERDIRRLRRKYAHVTDFLEVVMAAALEEA